ncbi:MAG: hypothetical protein K0B05_04015 [Bacteroidales bacterium]|nr:hypothetical protein [Bacteroidales bacterium]
MQINIKTIKTLLISALFSLLIIVLPGSLNAQFTLDLESGLVSTGYNDVRIPGNEGTLFSLNEDLDSDSKIFLRIRLNYAIGDRHTLSALYAPLTVLSDGSFSGEVNFEGVLFPAGNEVDATYKFNSYRLTYRYTIVKKPKFDFGLGFTAKIRDAEIALRSGELSGEKINVGFVPIINFRLAWSMSEKFGLLFEGDALAAPQGRAEDVLIAATYRPNDRFGFKAGYRLLEGGAENDEVYTFSLFHYASAGLLINF